MSGVLLTPELARAVRDMVRDYLRSSPELRRDRSGLPPRQHDYSIELGKVDAAVTAGNSVSVSIWRGTTKGSETDTGVNVTAYLRYSELASGSWCHVMYHNGGWEIFVGDPC